tara:strand:+ start:1785 stop:2105 length:321 start_codon:yes stop_codon:yes gene_type:complete
MDFKKEEIQEYFDDYIDDQDMEWIKENIEDLHYHVFNTDYFIVGTYEATQWLDNQTFNIVEFIRKYEDFHFGRVTTDFSNPENVVNMYAYIIGEEIVNDYKSSLSL